MLIIEVRPKAVCIQSQMVELVRSQPAANFVVLNVAAICHVLLFLLLKPTARWPATNDDRCDYELFFFANTSRPDSEMCIAVCYVSLLS